jgi:hypothetical protein
MLVAEALSLRKSNNDALNNLLQAISTSAYDPEEDCNKTVAKYLALHTEQEELIKNINFTNETTLVSEGLTLSGARVRRDFLIEAAGKLRNLPTSKKKAYSDEVHRLVLDSIKVRQTADDFSRQARELDNLIQKTNWNTELVSRF